MHVTTKSKVYEDLDDKGSYIEVAVEHDKDDIAPFLVNIGDKFEEWFSEADLRLFVKTLNKALLVRKNATE